MRIEILYKEQYPDGRALRLTSALKYHLGLNIGQMVMADVYLIDGFNDLSGKDAEEIFADPVAQEMYIDCFAVEKRLQAGWNYLIEVTYKPGVTNPVAITALDAIKNWFDHKLPHTLQVETAVQYMIKCENLSEKKIDKLLKYLHNPLIQKASIITREQWKKGKRPPAFYPYQIAASSIKVEDFDLNSMDDQTLSALSQKRLLALSLQEMKAIKQYFRNNDFLKERQKRGLPGKITDAEIEMIAQTWSEHCKHKILFLARINYQDDKGRRTIDSLFKTYIKKITTDLSQKKKYLKSVFHDNSGVIEFDKETLLCFKVETHNSPSALDPYGGAITGIVGVNRDIIGTGRCARPIFNTNVLCFGFPDTDENLIPEGLLPPRYIMEGVHRGIIDGGNQSGIPVVAGGFIFDDSYLGKPLVFCGTGGILPYKIGPNHAWEKEINPGDLAVMVGGRVGKDGIHGATFSSQALDEESPTSAVQIGDPITQKKMLDLLLEARDRLLFSGITDNGAGGLSSSLGEMATACGGVRIELDKCPLKYKGLAPWEILVSESQERMSLAVSPAKIDQFLALARLRDVEATVVGVFTDSGFVEILYQDKYVGLLDMGFLHDGIPRMSLPARWLAPPVVDKGIKQEQNIAQLLLKVLIDPNVASKENLVRQYDHEVQGCSILKPFVGLNDDGHSDGAVYKPRYNSLRGITITHGICPRYGDIDAYHMAMCAVDEAFRAHIACGGHPQQVAALDNFCWPDPVQSPANPDGAYKLAQLVRTCQGLNQACMSYGIPLISGKDSMKNDAVFQGRKVSVRPTLLISLMGIVPDVRKTISTDFKQAGDLIFLVGQTRGECGGSVVERILKTSLGTCPIVLPDKAFAIYQTIYKAVEAGLIQSCHDLSDGGLGVALVESAIGGRLGAEICLDNLIGPGLEKMETARLLFCETPSRLLVSVRPEYKKRFLALFSDGQVAELGVVTREQQISITRNRMQPINSGLNRLIQVWKGVF